MKVISLSVTRLYLLQGTAGYTLIDTGYSREYPLFLKELNNIGIKLNEIRFLFLTHHHDDHAGFVSRLIQEHPEIRIIARREAEPLLASGHNAMDIGSLLNRRITWLFTLTKLIHPKWDFTFPPVTLRPQDILLGTELDNLEEILGFSAKAVYTPGHTSDSQSLLLPEGTLFCGDAGANFLNCAGAEYCTVFNEDIDAVYRSWRSLLELGVRRVYPAHGRGFSAAKLEKHMNAHTPETVVPFIKKRDSGDRAHFSCYLTSTLKYRFFPAFSIISPS